ncbi:hypothetical protein glysoja_024857 [Glycine soja]|uniref:Uncharacterized protein n=1 Tax=Glycine soja TaxID=3848 RepID=A0A0B2QDY9_GLYSO|nr:hypothetical protein glysoja_024857 [Glycine soja]
MPVLLLISHLMSLEVSFQSCRRPRSAITRITLRAVKMTVLMLSRIGSDESEGDVKTLKEKTYVAAIGSCLRWECTTKSGKGIMEVAEEGDD